MKGFALTLRYFCILICFASCVSADRAVYDAYLVSGDYAGARNRLESDKKSLYAGTDAVLYNLDSGMLAHFAGDYDASNERLSEAEKLMEYYYAKSVAQTVGSFIVNDSVVDYAGEDYEDIYTNLFMALNYIQQRKSDDAFVEIRRFDNKLKLLAAKYEQAVFEANNQAERRLEEGGLSAHPPHSAYSPYAGANGQSEFHNSAFARYISLLLYRSEGLLDSARIDKKYAESAFRAQHSLYPFPIPEAIGEEFRIPEDKVRLNALCFTGLCPAKREEVLRIPNPYGGSWFKIALPVMEMRPSKIAYVEIEAAGASGKKTYGKLELLESIENIAEDTFRRKQALIYAKTFARALSKSITSAAVSAAIDAQDEGDGSMKSLAAFIDLLSGIFTEASEQADTRSSRCFPANVWAGGLNVEPGVYTVSVSCYDKNGRLVYSDTKKDVGVTGSSVALAEFVCMR